MLTYADACLRDGGAEASACWWYGQVCVCVCVCVSICLYLYLYIHTFSIYLSVYLSPIYPIIYLSIQTLEIYRFTRWLHGQHPWLRRVVLLRRAGGMEDAAKRSQPHSTPTPTPNTPSCGRDEVAGGGGGECGVWVWVWVSEQG